MIFLYTIAGLLIVWFLTVDLEETTTKTHQKLNEEQQLKYIQKELGLTTFTKEDGLGQGDNWYPKTRELLKALPQEFIEQKLDKMWEEYPTAQDYPYFLEVYILMSDELHSRKTKNKSN